MATITIYPEPFINEIFGHVLTEVDRAEKLHPDWPANDLVYAAAIVSEECGEVVREANHFREGHGNMDNLKTELIQTMATCIRMLKNLG